MSQSAPRDIIWLGCQMQHKWVQTGGASGGCGLFCYCSIPVHECADCGECDYGHNVEAEYVKTECANRREATQ